jgi:hypothetical protein
MKSPKPHSTVFFPATLLPAAQTSLNRQLRISKLSRFVEMFLFFDHFPSRHDGETELYEDGVYGFFFFF